MTGAPGFATAVALYRAGRRADSAAMLAQIFRQQPDNWDAADLLGLIMLEAGQPAAAAGPIRVAARGKPLDAGVQLRLAIALAGAGDDAGAARAQQRTAILKPDGQTVYIRRADILRRSADLAGAIRATGQALAVDPRASALWLTRAQFRLAMREAAGAASDAARASLLDPGNAAIQGLHAELLVRTGEPTRAEAILRRAGLVAPLDVRTWRSLAILLTTRRRRDEALPARRRALLLAPNVAEDWRDLAEALAGEFGRPAAVAAAKAWTCTDPGNGMAWLELADDLRAAAAPKAAVDAALSRAEGPASRTPLVRRRLAEWTYSDGDLAAASRHLESFFREVGTALAERRADLAVDQGVVEYLCYLFCAGRHAECLELVSGLEQRAGADENLAFKFRKLRLVSERVSTYFRDPAPWKGEERLVVSLPVWGRLHTAIWLRFGLPSLLADRNLAFWRSREVHFHILTTPETRPLIEADPLWRRMAELVRPVFIDLSPVLAENMHYRNYHAMILAHWVSLAVARADGADFLGLVADYLFSDGALGYLGQSLAAGGKDAFYTVDLPVSPAGAARFESFRLPDGGLAIPAARMAGIFLDHPSERIGFYNIGPGEKTVPSDASRLNIPFAGGIRIASMQPQLFYVRAGVLDRLWFPDLWATDNGFADLALAVIGDPERMEMLVDLDRFACAVLEVEEADRGRSGYFPKRQPSTDQIADLAGLVRRSGFQTPARLWALGHPLEVVRRDGSTGLAGARAFARDLQSAMPAPVSRTTLAMAQTIGRTLFARHLGL